MPFEPFFSESTVRMSSAVHALLWGLTDETIELIEVGRLMYALTGRCSHLIIEGHYRLSNWLELVLPGRSFMKMDGIEGATVPIAFCLICGLTAQYKSQLKPINLNAEEAKEGEDGGEDSRGVGGSNPSAFGG